jgi:hypothetical protein
MERMAEAVPDSNDQAFVVLLGNLIDISCT